MTSLVPGAEIKRVLRRLLGQRPDAIQVAALCRRAGDPDVLLVTSRGSGRWVLPKGWPMPGRTLAEAALQEAWEEAGVRGTVEPAPLGHYTFRKSPSAGLKVSVRMEVFAVTVEDLARRYPEADQRERRWFSPQAAAALVAELELRRLLASLDGN